MSLCFHGTPWSQWLCAVWLAIIRDRCMLHMYVQESWYHLLDSPKAWRNLVICSAVPRTLGFHDDSTQHNLKWKRQGVGWLSFLAQCISVITKPPLDHIGIVNFASSPVVSTSGVLDRTRSSKGLLFNFLPFEWSPTYSMTDLKSFHLTKYLVYKRHSLNRFQTNGQIISKKTIRQYEISTIMIKSTQEAKTLIL